MTPSNPTENRRNRLLRNAVFAGQHGLGDSRVAIQMPDFTNISDTEPRSAMSLPALVIVAVFLGAVAVVVPPAAQEQVVWVDAEPIVAVVAHARTSRIAAHADGVGDAVCLENPRGRAGAKRAVTSHGSSTEPMPTPALFAGLANASPKLSYLLQRESGYDTMALGHDGLLVRSLRLGAAGSQSVRRSVIVASRQPKFKQKMEFF